MTHPHVYIEEDTACLRAEDPAQPGPKADDLLRALQQKEEFRRYRRSVLNRVLSCGVVKSSSNTGKSRESWTVAPLC